MWNAIYTVWEGLLGPISGAPSQHLVILPSTDYHLSNKKQDTLIKIAQLFGVGDIFAYEKNNDYFKSFFPFTFSGAYIFICIGVILCFLTSAPQRQRISNFSRAVWKCGYLSYPRTQLAVPDEPQNLGPLRSQGPRLYRLNKRDPGTEFTSMISSIAYPDKSLFVRSSRSRFCSKSDLIGKDGNLVVNRKSNTDSAW